MPAKPKRRAPAKRAVAKKKAPAKKAAARKPIAKKAVGRKPVAKKRTAARKPAARPAAKKPAARKPAPARPVRTRRIGQGNIREDLIRLAERSASAARDEKAHAHELVVAAWEKEHSDDEPPAPDQGGGEPEEIRDRMSQASQPGVVVAERARRLEEGEPYDALTGGLVDGDAPAPDQGHDKAFVAAAEPHPSGETVIDVESLHVFYGAVEALKGASFKVYDGETVAIIGSNGAGKTTTLKTVSGVSELLKSVRGRITIMGQRVESWAAHKIAKLGVAHSPEGRKIFPNQTVRDNLMLGAFGRKDGQIDKDIAQMEERFPILGKRRNQAAGLMSGGEQQMLAMGRALMARPKVLLFDEPSMGLAPLIVKQIFDIIQELKREGKTILLVEQMAFQALGIADRAYVLETGAITMEGTGRQLLENPRVKEAYLGA